MLTHCGNNLKLVRELYNYTQVYVAKAIGVCDKTYREMEQKCEAPPAHYLTRLNQLYQVDISPFIFLSKEEILKRITLQQ